ncbi:glutaminase [Calycina marina]|uniref:Glutaminase n=1 Tax=Calycina marina TaxID=1763456 RepID=A0A9P7YYC6_9HELO|nr:glutaminase [Calycina marina]
MFAVLAACIQVAAMKLSTQSLFAWASAALQVVAEAQNTGSTFNPAHPPAIPIAVKSPYMNSWLQSGSDGGNGGYLPGRWQQFFTGATTAWNGMIRVDGVTYAWMGDPVGIPLAQQTSFEYTSTRSIFKIDVDGKVSLTATFLSPITPTDQKRQSLVFTYLNVEVTPIDRKAHKVQIYTDISAVLHITKYRQQQLQFGQTNDKADWGYWYYSTADNGGLTTQSGQYIVVRPAFANHGVLYDTQDTKYRPVSQDWPVFAFCKDFDVITGSVSTLFILGLAQTVAARLVTKTGMQPLNSLWINYFSDELQAVSFFYKDYAVAIGLADKFDHQVTTYSLAAGGQGRLPRAFGGLQLVGDLKKTYLFPKEISSGGNMQTVDVIFPFHPILLYTAPPLLKLLLDPLIEYQEAGLYPNKWAVHDLEGNYPNATGHNYRADEPMPLEECGNMIIMTLAYYQRTKDLAFLHQHWVLLTQWTEFLIEEALILPSQISTDDFAGPLANKTNLALKGIIGIEAMSYIANLTGHTAQATNWTNIAYSYITQWQTLGIAHSATPPHTTLSYGQNDTHRLLYNLYDDPS